MLRGAREGWDLVRFWWVRLLMVLGVIGLVAVVLAACGRGEEAVPLPQTVTEESAPAPVEAEPVEPAALPPATRPRRPVSARLTVGEPQIQL